MKTRLIYLSLLCLIFLNCQDDSNLRLSNADCKLPTEVFNWVDFGSGTYWVFEDSISKKKIRIEGNSVFEVEGSSSWFLNPVEDRHCSDALGGTGYICSHSWEQITLNMLINGHIENQLHASMGSYVSCNTSDDTNIREIDTLLLTNQGEFRIMPLISIEFNGISPTYESKRADNYEELTLKQV